MLLHAPAKLNLCLYLGPAPRGRPARALLAVRAAGAGRPDRGRRGASATRSSAPASRARTSPRGRWRRCASAGWEQPPLRVEIEKRIPVAAGLGGGSADAAAVLRLAAGEVADLPELAAELGADVPSQLRPRWPWSRAPASGSSRCPSPRRHAAVLLPGGGGLSTAEVFAEADRLGLGRDAGGARGARRPPARGGRRRRLAARLPRAARQRPRARRPLPAARRSATRSTRCARPAPRWPCSAAPARPRSASSPTSPPPAPPPPSDRPRRRDRLRGGEGAVKLPGERGGGNRKRLLAGDRRRGGRRRLLPAQPAARPPRPPGPARRRLQHARRLDLPAGRRLRLRRDRRLRRPRRPRRDRDAARRRGRRPGRDRHLPADRDRLVRRLGGRHDQLLHRPPPRPRVRPPARPPLRDQPRALRESRGLLLPPRRQDDLHRPLHQPRPRLRPLHRRQLGDALPRLRPLQHPRHRALGQRPHPRSATSSRAASTPPPSTPAKAPSCSAR